jgi:diguanylate cyclase (GGDEF)-like protein
MQMSELFQKLRWAASEEPYRGAQLELVIRGAGFLQVLGALVALALCAFRPPTAQIGALGWALVGSGSAFSIVLGLLRLTLRLRPSFSALRAVSVIGIVQIGLLQWLSGGAEPYAQLLLLPMLGAGFSEPMWRCAQVSALAVLVAFAPALYGHLYVLATVSEFGLLAPMTLMTSFVIGSTRVHRALLKDAREQATMLAHRDQLTGMPNRRAFDEQLARVAAAAELDGVSVSLLLCDVDSFKPINDNFGHAAGDEVLRAIGTALSAAVRGPDVAFRWAGDEFAVILPETDLEGAERVAARLRSAVFGQCSRPDGSPVVIGIGVAEMRAGMTLEQVLVEADRALFEQKSGRDDSSRAPRGWAEIRAAGSGRRIRSRERAARP